MSNVETIVTHIGAQHDQPATTAAGHNTASGTPSVEPDSPSTKMAKDQIRSIIDRVERLEEERKGTSDDIRNTFAEAKGNGFDVKALRTIIRMRKMDAGKRAEEETILETYLHALGML
jgi:uncharacterized protein (UPF0335 family)